jgi:cullin 1
MNDDNGQQRATLDLYRDKFQTHFLAATEAYYKKESEAFLAENSISDYLKKVEARLEEEARRVDLYLHHSTTKGVSAFLWDNGYIGVLADRFGFGVDS